MRPLAAGLLLLGALGCSHDATPTTTAGSLTVDLTSAGAHDGAVVVVVSGGPVDSVVALPGYQVVSQTDAAGIHLLILGSLAPGSLVRLRVPDISAASAYVATLEQVADGATFDLLDPANDRVSLRVVP